MSGEVPEVAAAVATAIAQKQQLRLGYHDKTRIVCPHLLGETKEQGLVLHAYQLAEADENGIFKPSPGWRFFYLDRAGPVAVVEKPSLSWEPALLAKVEGLTPGDPAVVVAKPEYKPPAFVTRVLAVVQKP